VQPELQHPVCDAVANLAVRLDRPEAVQAGPAGSGDAWVLPREALVLVVVAVDHDIGAGGVAVPCDARRAPSSDQEVQRRLGEYTQNLTWRSEVGCPAASSATTVRT
jgi:hypothetical protein